jgi:uncharacterized membrane protein YcaP (DUF421 family)
MSFSFPLLGEFIYRSFVSVFLLFIMAKIIGPRQIAQLNFYDYILGISVGSIAAAVAIDTTIPLWSCAVALIVYTIVSVGMAFGGLKSMRARRFFTGTPEILMNKGQFIEKNLKKNNLDINDITGLCRVNGFFEMSDLEYIIIETNGALSFLPKSEKAPLTPKDMQIIPSAVNLSANVILDGNIMEKHLESIGKDVLWLKGQLQEQNIFDPTNVLLATADKDGNFKAYLKDIKEENVDLFN